MSTLVPALKTELAQLESELRQDPRWRKIERIRALLQDYEDAQPSSGIVDMFADVAPATPVKHPHFSTFNNGVRDSFVKHTQRHLPKVEKVKIEIRTLLKEKGVAHRKDILERLKERGVMGYEKDPMASLAAYLSGFKDDFVFDGNGNYSLKPS
ncbi:MAG: hypothetical protein NT113_05180 [Hyphomicrobiales bacterium]|nr:hypothetical protein [Hyphomicrobiales bacterium]